MHPTERLLELFHRGYRIQDHGGDYVWAMDPKRRTKKRFDRVHYVAAILPILQGRATRKAEYLAAASRASNTELLPSTDSGSGNIGSDSGTSEVRMPDQV